MKTVLTGVLKIVVAVLMLLSIGDAVHMEGGEPKQAETNSGQWGSISEGLQLSVQLEKVILRVREPIVLKLLIKNTTKEVLPLVVSSPDMDYQISIRDEKGQNVALTKYGEKLRRNAGDHLARAVIKVSPGQEVSHSLTVSEIYNMTAPGTYSITAKRTVFRRDGKGIAELMSNMIEVTVIQKVATGSQRQERGNHSDEETSRAFQCCWEEARPCAAD